MLALEVVPPKGRGSLKGWKAQNIHRTNAIWIRKQPDCFNLKQSFQVHLKGLHMRGDSHHIASEASANLRQMDLFCFHCHCGDSSVVCLPNVSLCSWTLSEKSRFKSSGHRAFLGILLETSQLLWLSYPAKRWLAVSKLFSLLHWKVRQ